MEMALKWYLEDCWSQWHTNVIVAPETNKKETPATSDRLGN